MPTGTKKRQKDNPPVRTRPNPPGPMTKLVKAMVKRSHRKPTIPKGR